MLLPEADPVMSMETSRSAEKLASLNQSMTEDYGDAEAGRRTLGGGIDFFSSLGTERKKKPKEEKPDPDKVRDPLAFLSVKMNLTRQCSFVSVVASSTSSSRKENLLINTRPQALQDLLLQEDQDPSGGCRN